jgi:hypothetical protein
MVKLGWATKRLTMGRVIKAAGCSRGMMSFVGLYCTRIDNQVLLQVSRRELLYV